MLKNMETLNQLKSFIDSNSVFIQFLVLIVLLITLVLVLIQTITQNKLYKAQILRDRFDLYNNTKGLITDKHITDFKNFSQDYINEYTEYYSKSNDNIHTYLYFGKIYEYLLYVWELKDKYNLKDPLGNEWEQKWLIEYKDEQAFADLREFNKEFYSDFDGHLEKQIQKLSEDDTIPKI